LTRTQGTPIVHQPTSKEALTVNTKEVTITNPEFREFQPGDRVRMVNPECYANLAPVGTICTVAYTAEGLVHMREDLDIGGTFPWRWELVKEEPTETPKAPKPLVSDETARDLILALEAAHAALCALRAGTEAPYTMGYIKDVLEDAKEEVRGATGS
jgi:hypothetical protein